MLKEKNVKRSNNCQIKYIYIYIVKNVIAKIKGKQCLDAASIQTDFNITRTFHGQRKHRINQKLGR